MEEHVYHIIGVMSGTSLDGIDLAYMRLEKTDRWQYRFLKAQTFPYAANWKNRLEQACRLPEKELEKLDIAYTNLLAETIARFIGENYISPIDAVCSHGHTVLHRPENGVTFQMGNRVELAKKLQQTVVCDFRKQDVLLGGQGAPLVPIGDALLFSEFDFCINLGGFANVSTRENNQRIAYDICAANTVLNVYAERLGEKYDPEGKIAASGKINPELFNALEALPFYREKPPKSLGIEWVHAEIFPLINKAKLSDVSVLATFTAHIAKQITVCIGNDSEKKCLLTGGGAYNDFLLKSVQQQTRTQLIVPNKNLIEYKEALVFGLLGVLKLRNETNILSSVTGAVKDHSSGVVWKNL